MVYIHVKKPRLIQLTKEKGQVVQKVVRRDMETSKIYDNSIKNLEAHHSKFKENLNRTGNVYGEKS